MHGTTFSCMNYLQMDLSHKYTAFSKDSKKKFYFQLIQHSLVPGVDELSSPIFVDGDGSPLSIEAPFFDVPDDAAIKGEA